MTKVFIAIFNYRFKIMIKLTIDGRVVFASCEDDQGGIVTSEVVLSEKGNHMKTTVKTQQGDKMELLTDNNGNKIKTKGQIKTRDEKLTLWKVCFIISDIDTY